MAEITTPALRRLVRDYSPGMLVYSEMLSAGAVAAGSRHNAPLMDKHDFDDPLVYQILGSDPAVMAEACAILCEKGCYGIDINMGCSAPEIMKKNQGARLLKDPGLARDIVRACRRATPAKLSAKIRTGFDSFDDSDIVAFARMLEECGADHIAVHPRFARLGFRRAARWDLVALIKRSLSIPVIGSGDITSPAGALKRLDETPCDAVMISREAVKSPWIFRLCSDLLSGSAATLDVDRESLFIAGLEGTRDLLPAELHRSRALRFSFYFSKNALYGHSLHTSLRACQSIDDMIDLVRQYYDRNPGEKGLRFQGGHEITNHNL
jgi:nifR3 family TIM-barrel protein